jgi:threonine synthase
MLYHSTRNIHPTVDSAEAVLKGLAADGGLYMPESMPQFDWQKCLQGDTYAMATQILGTLLPDIPNMESWCAMPTPENSRLRS